MPTPEMMKVMDKESAYSSIRIIPTQAHRGYHETHILHLPLRARSQDAIAPGRFTLGFEGLESVDLALPLFRGLSRP